MESDSIIKQKALAIKSFMDLQPDTYLNMVHRAKIRLGTALGFSSRTTTLAEDIMNEVFCDIISGTRKWDMEKFKLEQVLWENIRSEVSARAKKEIRYVLTPTISNGGDDESGRSIDDIISTKPEDVEGQVDAETIETYCCNVILKDDEDAQKVFNEMLNGKRQKDIADDLGMTVRETEAKIRNIRRMVSKQLPRYLMENLTKSLITKILNQT
jgi:hypothetical protein